MTSPRPLSTLLLALALLGSACGTAADPTAAGDDLFDASTVHVIEIDLEDQDAYDAMVQTYLESGEKDWIEATVTIDGTTLTQVGLRLKGNSSLRGISASDDPATLPWLIRLDKYVEGQSLDGITDLVVRSSTTETSLNEAVALELLDLAGVPAQEAMAARVSVDGGAEVLRLVIEHPDDTWMAEEFGTDGALYKAESTGDWSYRGEDADAYDEVFDQEAGEDVTDLAPLTDFLQFINEADDETFARELGDHLDVEAFATYLAVQDLIGNFDDIDGPGNNAYLHVDVTTGLMTVVAWDHNLTFGAMNQAGGPGGETGPGGGGPAGGPVGGPGDGRPAGAVGDGARPETAAGGPADGGFGGPGGANVLVERFMAVEAFAQAVEDAGAALEAELLDSGVAEEVVDRWVQVLTDDAADLVPASTITAEAAAITSYLDR